jgi:hypothetical protein
VFIDGTKSYGAAYLEQYHRKCSVDEAKIASALVSQVRLLSTGAVLRSNGLPLRYDSQHTEGKTEHKTGKDGELPSS